MNRHRVEADFALQYEPKGSGLSPSEVVAVYIKAEAEQAFYATQCLYPYQELNPHYLPF